jgi:hypothetical protein
VETMERPPKALFCWSPSLDTLVALGSGFTILVLSALMGRLAASGTLASMLLRDVGMLIFVGTLFPLWFIQHRHWRLADFGLHIKRWQMYVLLNLGLGGMLFGSLRLGRGPWELSIDSHTLGCALYVMLAGIFEVVFFYGFQLTLFERAFGTVLAVLLTAVFYSFHHMGFQSEFLKLFIVGIMYGSVCRLAKSVLIIYPFFWGVGALFDVLIGAQAIVPITSPWPRSIGLLGFMAVAIYWGKRQRFETFSAGGG